MKRFLSTVSSFFASRAFFIAVMVFFVTEAVWIAVSALYPMAFDEDFHLGIIKIYATHWSPFLTQHPAGADAFGAITRDPSYLYHYLMSFPYRLLTTLFDSETTRIIILRLINVALFAYALVLFRRLLLRITRSRGFAHVAIAIFALIPIVPQLAAHINYDNLLMVLMAWACLLVTDVHRQFNAGRFDLRKLCALLVVCLFASVVKYAFLPIFVAIIIFVLYDAYANFKNWRGLKRPLAINWAVLSVRTKLGLLGVLLLGGGLFFQRFGINTITYHTPIPSCDQVLSIDHCSAYGPWNRDYLLAQSKGDVNENPIAYSGAWLKGLWWRLFFAINSPTREYANYPPLPFPAATAIGLAVLMFLTLVFFFKRVFKGQPLLIFCGTVVLVYCSTLWLEDYAMFRETGQPVAINGRYLIPVLLLMAALGWKSITLAFAKLDIMRYRSLLALVVLLLFLQGGGVFTFIMRSDSSWYWPNNNTVLRMNDTARNILDPFIIQGSKQTKTTL